MRKQEHWLLKKQWEQISSDRWLIWMQSMPAGCSCGWKLKVQEMSMKSTCFNRQRRPRSSFKDQSRRQVKESSQPHQVVIQQRLRCRLSGRSCLWMCVKNNIGLAWKKNRDSWRLQGDKGLANFHTQPKYTVCNKTSQWQLLGLVQITSRLPSTQENKKLVKTWPARTQSRCKLRTRRARQAHKSSWHLHPVSFRFLEQDKMTRRWNAKRLLLWALQYQNYQRRHQRCLVDLSLANRSAHRLHTAQNQTNLD